MRTIGHSLGRMRIVDGSRDIQYGHKLNLSSGKSGLILDLVIETGNPADTHRLLPMLDRHIKNYAAVPRQLAVALCEQSLLMQPRRAVLRMWHSIRNVGSASSRW